MKTNRTSLSVVRFAMVLIAPVLCVSAQPLAKFGGNLSGVWVNSTLANAANHLQSQWVTDALPFTAKGLAMFDANKPGKGPRGSRAPIENDPLTKSNPAGLYRTLICSRPFEIIQLPERVIQVFELGKNWRAIYTDGRPVPKDVDAGPYWYGYSVGKWEGDALVVTTIVLDERAWLDEWGTPFSGDARVEERWQRTGTNKLQLKVTVNDPVLYSRPWTSSPVTYTLQRGVDLEEIIYAPVDGHAFGERVRTPAHTLIK